MTSGHLGIYTSLTDVTVISTDVQTLLVNWRHADRILNVPVLHCVSVERASGYVVAATTDFDPLADPLEVEREMHRIGDFSLPRAWRKHGRLWAFGEYQDSILRGVMNNLTPEEVHFASNSFDLPGTGGRIRGDIFQAAHMMLVKKLVGGSFRQLVLCLDGDAGLARLACALFASDVIDGRVHVADVRFSKELGNQRRNKLVVHGAGLYRTDLETYAALMRIAKTADGLNSAATQLVAARLLASYAVAPSQLRAEALARNGYEWRYHRKEEPEKTIRLLTDRGDLSFGDLAMLLSRCTMAPVDKYFAQARRRVRAFDRGSRPTSGRATWYVSAFYNPEMVEKLSTILRFYHNFMLLEAPSKGMTKSERRTPGMKIGAARGLVYVRDILSFS